MTAARVVWLALVLGATLYAQERVELRLSPEIGEVGLLMQLEVAVIGPRAADCEVVELPEVDGARLEPTGGRGTQQSLQIVDGRMTRSLETRFGFRLVPERKGRLTIGPFVVDCGGERIRSAPRTLDVVDSVVSDVVDLEVIVDPEQLWVGQSFHVDVEATIDEAWLERRLKDGLRLELPWREDAPGTLLLRALPTDTGYPLTVVLEDGSALAMDQYRDNSSGRSRIVLTRSFELIATEAGELQLPRSRFEAHLARTIEERANGFGLFRQSQRIASSIVIADAVAEGPRLEVRALPETGRPRNATNAVGSFRLTGTASPREVAVGETCKVSLALSGTGNLEFVQFPTFERALDDFRLFGKEERTEHGARVLELEVSPKSQRVTEIPALEIGVFDPEAGRWETLTAGPFPLTVEAGGSEGLVSLETPQQILEDLETIVETPPAPAPEPWPTWWLWTVPLVGWIGVEVDRRRRGWREANPAAVARRGARRRLEAALADATTAGDVAVAFAHFLSDRFDGPPAGMSADDLAGPLADDPDLLERVRRTGAGWDAARFGGAAMGVDEAAAQARELADALEDVG